MKEERKWTDSDAELASKKYNRNFGWDIIIILVVAAVLSYFTS
jgi:hypothetical protein